MDELELDLDTPAIETDDVVDTPASAPQAARNTAKKNMAYLSAEEMTPADNLATGIGRFSRETALESTADEISDIYNFDDVSRQIRTMPEIKDGKITLPDISDTMQIMSLRAGGSIKFPIMEASRAANTGVLELMSADYKADYANRYARQNRSIVGQAFKDVDYMAGSAIRGILDIGFGALGFGSSVIGMGVQEIGTLTGSEDIVDVGVLMQDTTVQLLNSLNNWFENNLNERNPTKTLKKVGQFTQIAAPIAASVAATYMTGGAASGSIVAAAAGRGLTKAVADRAAKSVAKQAAKRISRQTRTAYASTAAQGYLAREAESKSSAEYRDYLRQKTGGDILSDTAWAAVVGVSNYYLEKAFGANASISRYFGTTGQSLLKATGMSARSALEEGITEVAQDMVLEISDWIRGGLGNEDRGISFQDVKDRFISPDTLETFVMSAIIGGGVASGEYYTARKNLTKEFKQNVKRVFPQATEKQLEDAATAFITDTEQNGVGKAIKALAADDQFVNEYGTYTHIMQNRINTLIDQSIEQGKELALADKSPEYQAQFSGAVAQEFTQQLYAQALQRGVPVVEVFDTTQIDVEDGVMYMYGAEYGKRPLTVTTRNLTPAQFQRVQVEKAAADRIQAQEKVRAEEMKKELAESKRLEREQLRQEREAEKETAKLAKEIDKQAVVDQRRAEQQQKILARADIRKMDEDTARGLLAEIRDDLPVETLNKTEIKQLLRSEINRVIAALPNISNIQPIKKAPTIAERQKIMTDKRVRMAKPKSFSQMVKSAGINKDTIVKLGLEGELKQILDKDYRFYVRKNGTITNMEEFAGEYQTEGDSYQGSVNGFLELLERDLKTKDIYSADQETAVKNWEQNSINAGKQQAAVEADLTEQDIDARKAYMQEKGLDVDGLTNEEIIEQSNKLREVEFAQNQAVAEYLDGELDEIPEDLYFQSSERTQADINTPEFQKWFGDSKVVDADGKPLVVYHSTNNDFDTFEQRQGFNSSQFGSDSVLRKGFFFTDNKTASAQYGKIEMPTYLSIQKPFDIDNMRDRSLESYDQEFWNGYYDLIENAGLDVYPTRYSDNWEFFDDKAGDIFVDYIKSKGYDGAFMQESDFLNAEDKKSIRYQTWIAFEPNQIKSIYNEGTFNPDTGNIYYQENGRKLAAWNPFRRSIELFDGANETSISHELSHFWLDNMMIYSRLQNAIDTPFMQVWKNIKDYLGIDDRQQSVSERQAEKYTSAYMQYLKDTKIEQAVDLGFKGMDEYIGEMADEFFMNYKHVESVVDDPMQQEYAELEEITPAMVDTLQKLTTIDLSVAKEHIISEMVAKEEEIESFANTLATNVEAEAIETGQETANPMTPADIKEQQARSENRFETGERATRRTAARTERDTGLLIIDDNKARYNREDQIAMTEEAQAVVQTPEGIDYALSVLRGEEVSDIRNGIWYNALKNVVKATGNMDLAEQLVYHTDIIEEATEAGREVAAFKDYAKEHQTDAVNAILAVNKIAENTASKDAKKQLELNLVEISNIVDNFTDNIPEQDYKDWFDSMNCKI